MIYQWLSDLIGIVSGYTQNSTLINISGVLVVMLFVVTVDFIFSLIFNLFKKGRYR